MTQSHHPSDLPALDLLGQRLESATAQRRAPSDGRGVRWRWRQAQ